jgi:hypothetical protein
VLLSFALGALLVCSRPLRRVLQPARRADDLPAGAK